jgi:hypothetical protein
MSRLTDFFLPILEKATAAQAAEDQRLEAEHIEAARTHSWAHNEELALEEARRLADSEEDRRRSAEGKATTYLLFASAFAAALIPFLPGILEGKTGAAPGWVIAVILIVATFYLVAAGWWAFRALRVGTFHRLDVAELVQIWSSKDPRRSLIQQTFALARMNYRSVNDKVSCVIMAQEFIVRSFVVFGVLIIVEAGWEAVSPLIGADAHRGSVATQQSSKVERRGAVEPVPDEPKPKTEDAADQPAPSVIETKSAPHPGSQSDNPGGDLSQKYQGPPNANNPVAPAEGSSGNNHDH